MRIYVMLPTTGTLKVLWKCVLVSIDKNNSGIYLHYMTDHDMVPPKFETFISQVEIVYSSPVLTPQEGTEAKCI